MEWVLDEVLDSGVPLLPGPTSGGGEAASPGAGLTDSLIHRRVQDYQQQPLKARSTF